MARSYTITQSGESRSYSIDDGVGAPGSDASVTTANVRAAGALMDDEVDADIKTLTLPANTTISTFGASLIDDAAASNARTTLGLGTAAVENVGYFATAAQGLLADSSVQPARLVSTSGLATGGGDLSADRTIDVPAASQAETEAAAITTKAVVPAYLRMKIDGSAFVAGDLTGNSRGSNSLDVQSQRSVATQVASGISSMSLGLSNTASASGAVALGNTNTASGVTANATGSSNTASGTNSTAIGNANTAGATDTVAIGRQNTADGLNSSLVGRYNFTGTGTGVTALGILNNQTGGSILTFPSGSVSGTPVAANAGISSVAIGNVNRATATGAVSVGHTNLSSGSNSSAIGSQNTASGSDSVSVGRRVTTSVSNTAEFGYWSSTTVRTATCRMQADGQVAFTIRDSASAPTDGGATAGSEANNTLARGMFSIQKNGTAVTLYFNNAGTIQSLSLGTLA